TRASGNGSRIPHWPDFKGSPKAQARMVKGLPRPAIAGSASLAPASAKRRINGIGLISVFIGENPETTMPGSTFTGNARAAIVAAAAARSAAGKASRKARACSRNLAFGESVSTILVIAISAEPRWPLEHRSRVPYESRWAPYDRTHEPGQGQLPEGSIRPRGLCLLTRPAAPPAQCSRYVAHTPLCGICQPIGTLPPLPTV